MTVVIILSYSCQWMTADHTKIWSDTSVIQQSFTSLVCVRRISSLCRRHGTKNVMLMTGIRTEAPGLHRQGKLFADKWDLVLSLSRINWWVLLVEGARYHGGFPLYASLAKWMTLWRAKKHLVTQRCRALLNRWQETSEDSGNGHQMVETLCCRS